VEKKPAPYETYMTGWSYELKYNRAQEQRPVIEEHFPVFDAGQADT